MLSENVVDTNMPTVILRYLQNSVKHYLAHFLSQSYFRISAALSHPTFETIAGSDFGSSVSGRAATGPQKPRTVRCERYVVRLKTYRFGLCLRERFFHLFQP